jgi:hypothetical protein
VIQRDAAVQRKRKEEVSPYETWSVLAFYLDTASPAGIHGYHCISPYDISLVIIAEILLYN